MTLDTTKHCVPSEDWLEEHDALLEAQDVPLPQRPVKALNLWNQQNSKSFLAEDFSPTFARIIEFYETRRGLSSQTLELASFSSVFLYANKFHKIGPFDGLGDDPDSIGHRIVQMGNQRIGAAPPAFSSKMEKCFGPLWPGMIASPGDLHHAVRVFNDGSAYTLFRWFCREVEFLGKRRSVATLFVPSAALKEGTREYMEAAHAQLKLAQQGLLEPNGPSSDTLHPSIMAIEMFLKALLHERANITVLQLKGREFGHKLDALVKRVVAESPGAFDNLLALLPVLELPEYRNDMDKKYLGESRLRIGYRARYKIYDVALYVAAFVARNLVSQSGPKAAPKYL